MAQGERRQERPAQHVGCGRISSPNETGKNVLWHSSLPFPLNNRPSEFRNKTRWPMHPVWSIVQHAFDTLDEQPARELIRLKKQQVNIDAATASIAGYLSSRTVWQCNKTGVPVEKVGIETAVADLLEDIEKLLQDRGVSFQQVLQAKQRRYYLRQEATDKAYAKREKSFFETEPEPE